MPCIRTSCTQARMPARLPKTVVSHLLNRSQLPAKLHSVRDRTELAVKTFSKRGSILDPCSGILDSVRMMATHDTVEKSNEEEKRSNGSLSHRSRDRQWTAWPQPESASVAHSERSLVDPVL